MIDNFVCLFSRLINIKRRSLFPFIDLDVISVSLCRTSECDRVSLSFQPLCETHRKMPRDLILTFFLVISFYQFVDGRDLRTGELNDVKKLSPVIFSKYT